MKRSMLWDPFPSTPEAVKTRRATHTEALSLLPAHQMTLHTHTSPKESVLLWIGKKRRQESTWLTQVCGRSTGQILLHPMDEYFSHHSNGIFTSLSKKVTEITLSTEFLNSTFSSVMLNLNVSDKTDVNIAKPTQHKIRHFYYFNFEIG